MAPQPPLSTRPVYLSLSLSIYCSGLWSFFILPSVQSFCCRSFHTLSVLRCRCRCSCSVSVSYSLAVGDRTPGHHRQGPETVIEQLVKGRRMTTEQQLGPMRLNLRFLLNAVGSIAPRSPTDAVSLSTVVEMNSIQAIMAQLEQRRAGPARIYALSLLLKKVCVYLCSRQSSASMLYISPQTLPSWQLIDSYCNQSSRKRKLRQRDRLVLHTSQSTMTAEELTLVVRGCLAVLDGVMQKSAADSDDGALGLLKTEAKRFTEYFITVCFALLLAPRQQVFRAMTMDSLEQPQENTTANYIIRLSAERTKVGHPVLLRAGRAHGRVRLLPGQNITRHPRGARVLAA